MVLSSKICIKNEIFIVMYFYVESENGFCGTDLIIKWFVPTA